MYSNSITREYKFSYAHQLNCSELSEEGNEEKFGKCVNMHGHNAKVLITVAGPTAHGMVINFKKLDEFVDPLLDAWDHQLLNKLTAFEKLIPTAENMAYLIFTYLTNKLRDYDSTLLVRSVTVYENDRSCATYAS